MFRINKPIKRLLVILLISATGSLYGADFSDEFRLKNMVNIYKADVTCLHDDYAIAVLDSSDLDLFFGVAVFKNIVEFKYRSCSGESLPYGFSTLVPIDMVKTVKANVTRSFGEPKKQGDMESYKWALDGKYYLLRQVDEARFGFSIVYTSSKNK